jgi:hypothetical protein
MAPGIRGAVGCALLVIGTTQETLAQTLTCDGVGSWPDPVFAWPTMPAGHSCAAYFGSTDGTGTADGRGLCAMLDQGLQDGPCRPEAVPTDPAWWTEHVTCTQETANCKTSAEIAAGPASSQAWSGAPATANNCYRV